MLRLCVCADDISPDLDEQIRACKLCGISHVELRSIHGVNVLDFVQPVRAEVKARLDAAGIGVACIGSNVGRVPISEPWNRHFDRFKTAIDSAAYFGAPMVRIFSYSTPSRGEDVHHYRDEILRRMRAKVEHVTGGEITLVQANERGCYGEQSRECADLLSTVNSRTLRCAFDPGGFVISGQRAAEAWAVLKPFTAYIYASDARFRDRQRCPPAEGDAQVAPIVGDALRCGYRGFLCLDAQRPDAFGGVETFKATVDALRALCARASVSVVF